MRLFRSFPGPRSFQGIPSLRPLLRFTILRNLQIISYHFLGINWSKYFLVFLGFASMYDLSRNSCTETFFRVSGPTSFLGIFSLFIEIPGSRTWSCSCAIQEISHPRFRLFLRVLPGFLGYLGSKHFSGIAFKSPDRNCSISPHPICPHFVSRSGNSCYHFLSEISISLCRAETLHSFFKISYHRSDFLFFSENTLLNTLPPGVMIKQLWVQSTFPLFSDSPVPLTKSKITHRDLVS